MPEASFATRVVELAYAAPLAGRGREHARLAILDSIAVALPGADQPGPRIVRRAASAGRSSDATVWHDRRPVALTDTVLANAVAAHALDYDCLIPAAFVQPGAVLIPGLVAIAQRDRRSGSELLDATCRGLTVLRALGTAVGDVLHTAGWHPTTVLGVVASAAASASLLGLDRARAETAVNLAAALSGGLKQSFGTQTKELQVGEAARAGVWAAVLASEGMTSGPAAADAWLRLVTGSTVEPALGDSIEPSIHVKKYPCCGRMHAALDLAVEQRERGVGVGVDLDVDLDVGEIVCVLNPHDLSHIDRAAVHSAAEAKFSVQYGLAATLLRGRLGLDDFEVSGQPAPEVARLMAKVRIETADRVPSFGAELRLVQVGGEPLQARAEAPVAASAVEVAAKFVDCARAAHLDLAAAGAFTRLMRTLDDLSDVRVLVEALPGPANPDVDPTATDEPALEEIST